MVEMTFIMETLQAEHDIQHLTAMINDEHPGYGQAFSFGFSYRNNDNDIIAGCNGSIIYGAIYTDQLWVHPKYRGQGLAKKLMDHVHNFGFLQHCSIATVTTMNFQNTEAFYKKLDYKVDFIRLHTQSSTMIYMSKNLL